MIKGFDDGRSRSFYCVAATVMEPAELKAAIKSALQTPVKQGRKARAIALRIALEQKASEKGYLLKLRK